MEYVVLGLASGIAIVFVPTHWGVPLRVVIALVIYTLALSVYNEACASEYEVFDLPGRGGAELVLEWTAPVGREEQAALMPRVWRNFNIAPNTTLGLQLRGFYDVDRNEYVGTQATVGIRRTF